ncbi:ROK family protein [uncultured Jannaschia sp.]|uniref:ROK family protein n=1 Tax=uncultured Jannaschia sp. TaxID=293347 RepID=UPI00260916AB|nr:ROK family protein [uncultured Jannaschia sp.]
MPDDPDRPDIPTGPRSATERAFLSVVQRQGPIAAGEVARALGLSAQAGSVLSRALETDGFLLRGAPVRGRVGKPSIPLALAPDGLFSLGLRIGRRRADLVLMDFTGGVRGAEALSYAWPTPQRVEALVRDAAPRLTGRLADGARIAGLGIAAPFELWTWLEQLGAPKAEMEVWRDTDLAARMAAITGLAVTVGNDGTLACCGEQVFGRGRDLSNFAYFFVGAFVGGGVVLDGRLFEGANGNAGAFGSLPVEREGRRGHQLIDHASLYLLERQLVEAGRIGRGDDLATAEWDGFGGILDDWLDRTARHLASAAIAVTAVLAVPAVVLDGSLPPAIRTRLVERVARRMRGMETRGLTPPEIVEGSLGRMAGALGSAYQPIVRDYLTPEASSRPAIQRSAAR